MQGWGTLWQARSSTLKLTVGAILRGEPHRSTRALGMRSEPRGKRALPLRLSRPSLRRLRYLFSRMGHFAKDLRSVQFGLGQLRRNGSSAAKWANRVEVRAGGAAETVVTFKLNESASACAEDGLDELKNGGESPIVGAGFVAEFRRRTKACQSWRGSSGKEKSAYLRFGLQYGPRDRCLV